ncbi:MAG: BACON domain-containing protein [Bacteroidales bacterium]|nr:BACON domain-containing protein [Bacteroidales bacterium]
MELRRFIFGVIASMAIFAACEQEEQNLGTPNLTLSMTEMTFDEAGGNQTLTLNATRDWMVETNADWVVVNPESGSASADDQAVTVTVLENSGMDREVDLKFTIGMKSKYLTVSQAGPGGSAEALVVYYNDYDKVEAEKTYGSGSSWPYLDQFDGWMNETGTGAANVEYSYSGMSARANSTSDSNYSDYPGSGKNNMFFGKSAYLATKNIALGGATDFTLTFGTEKYSQDYGSVFTKSEYHIFVSNDAAKWVEITDYTFAGEGTEGRWNIATADFSVPAGTENLSICVKVDVASSYRMDDFKLVISDGGATVDFSKGVEMDFTAGGSTGGGSTTAPESKGKKTVEEFIAAADNSNYYELTGKVSGFNPTYCSFDLTDATGEIYVYSVLDASKAEWTDKISNGGTITIYGKYLYYEQKSQHEVVDAYIVSFKADGSGSTGGNESEKPESLIKATVADFLAAPESSDTWYELTGEITSIVSGNAYGNLHINDGTGEVYIYGLTNGWVGYNDKSFNSIGLKVGDTVTLGTLRGSYNGEPQGGGNKVPAYYISHVPGEGGEVVTPPAGEAGEYEPQGVTWTLGEKAYDNTSGNNAQTGTVNGVSVSNILKLGTGSLVGDATLHVAAGTKKLGFYCVAWKGKTAQVKFSVDGTEVTTITPAANTGATGNPPYASITVTESDYFEVELPSGATDVKVETLDPANGRVLFIGLKAIIE